MQTEFELRLSDELRTYGSEQFSLEGTRAAAVLIPVVGGSELTLVFTRRTETLRSHKGQISFPGGSVDPQDESATAAALREAQEEIGLDPATVRILGELDSTPTFVSGFVVTPVVGYLEQLPPLTPNPDEVAEVLEIPLGELNEAVRREPGFLHQGWSLPTEAWVWRGHVIWGVTARLLRLFFLRLAAAGLADPPGETRSPWPPPPIRR